MKRLVLATLAIHLLATPALALDQGTLAAKVQKYIKLGGPNVRTVCICKQPGNTYLKAGYLISAPSPVPGGTVGIGIGCNVPLFYGDGQVASSNPCNSNFEVLGT